MADKICSSSHPLLPPTSEDERVSWLRLLRSRRVGITTFYNLLREYDSADAALKALPEIARKAGVVDYHVCEESHVLKELEMGARFGAQLVFRGEAAFPALLSEIGDCPPFVWMKGNLSLLQKKSIAMVGARNASSLGLRMARRLAGDLGQEGFVCVSGLARGIDTAVHKASLQTGTIAVLAGGLDVIYPAENTSLASQIAEDGILLSEHPFGQRPLARHFPVRNRLVSGLAKGLVVVEAASKSGSLITAQCALEQGRDVFAVPGHPFDARSAGCNFLIRDGAVLARGREDITDLVDAQNEPRVMLKTLSVPDIIKPKERRTLRETALLHSEILDRLSLAPISEDQLIRDLRRSAADTSATVVQLELEGKVIRQPGGFISKVS